MYSEFETVPNVYLYYENGSILREAALPSGLGRWVSNLEVSGSNLLPYCYLDLFSVVLNNSTSWDS